MHNKKSANENINGRLKNLQTIIYFVVLTIFFYYNTETAITMENIFCYRIMHNQKREINKK